METPNGPTTAPTAGISAACHSASQGPSSGFGRRRGLVIAGGVTAAGAAFGLSQHWFAAADLVPLLFVLPCAAMMFMCMKGMSHGQQAGNAAAPTGTDTPAASESRS